MAMVKCSECGKDVSSEAAACPHCGVKIASGESGCTQWAAGCATIAVLSIFTIILLARDSGAPSSQVTDTRADAYYACVEFATRQLKAPATAKFPPYRDGASVVISAGANKRWIVAMHVDAQNSFGAMIRSNVGRFMTHVGGSSFRPDSTLVYAR